MYIYMIVYYIYIYNHKEELSSDIGLKEIIYSSAFNFANGILYSVQESWSDLCNITQHTQ